MPPMRLVDAVEALGRGRLVGMPTETVYGLAGDATEAEVVLRIFQAKGRPVFDPLIVHVADPDQAWTVAEPTPRARLLAGRFWPGPLTLVLRRRTIIPDLVTSGLDTVGVRCPDHPLARELIRAFGRPVAAPSANRFGSISPTTAEHVRDQFGAAIAGVLDGGACRIGVESTVLLPDPRPLILRPGGVTREALAEVLGEPVALADRAERAAGLPAQAPGMLASHYAPRIPMSLREAGSPWPTDQCIARLAFRDLPPPGGPSEVLSPTGDIAEAARRLFAAMRRLDASGATSLLAERVPDHGLGVAINDRLQRAAGLG